jgi:hypothetical protein
MKMGMNLLSVVCRPQVHKSIKRRVITSKVTLTGQSHFMLIFVLLFLHLESLWPHLASYFEKSATKSL